MSLLHKFARHARRGTLLRATANRLWNDRQNIVRICDLRNVTDDPMVALYRTCFRPALIDVPMDRIRSENGIAYVRDGSLPYISAAVACIAGRDEEARRILMAHFESEERHLYLWSVLPWSPVAKQIHRASEQDRATDADIVVRLKKIRALAESIKTKGYLRSDDLDGDISGEVLAHDKAWVVRLTGGTHRASVLAALGFHRAAVRLPRTKPYWPLPELPTGAAQFQPLVRREDVAYWPNVRNGLYTEVQALAAFDRIFHGSHA